MYMFRTHLRNASRYQQASWGGGGGGAEQGVLLRHGWLAGDPRRLASSERGSRRTQGGLDVPPLIQSPDGFRARACACVVSSVSAAAVCHTAAADAVFGVALCADCSAHRHLALPVWLEGGEGKVWRRRNVQGGKGKEGGNGETCTPSLGPCFCLTTLFV